MEFLTTWGLWLFMYLCIFAIGLSIVIFSYGALRYKSIHWIRESKNSKIK